MRPTNTTKITFDDLGHPSFWYYDQEGIAWAISRREYIAKTQIHTYQVRGKSNIKIDVNTIDEARDIVRNHRGKPEWVDKVFKAHHDINGVVKELRYRGI